MESYFNPAISEETYAAYLDGMLPEEDAKAVEELIESDPHLSEIQSDIDAIDSSYIFDHDIEIPVECLADDFSLPLFDMAFEDEMPSYLTVEEYTEDDEPGHDTIDTDTDNIDFDETDSETEDWDFNPENDNIDDGFGF